MKKVKKSILWTLVAAISFGLVSPIVNAAGLKAENCQGDIYTNYYYLIDAEVWDLEDSEMMDKITSLNLKNQGLFSNNIILINGLKTTGFQNVGVDYLVEKGKVPVTNSASNGINNINVRDFYQTVVDSKNHSDGSWVLNDGVTANIVRHNYRNVSDSSTVSNDIIAKLVLSDATVNDLVNASVELNEGIKIGYVEEESTNYEINLTLQIYRDYSGATGYNGNLSSVVPVDLNFDGATKKWFLQPAAYYIQYCVSKNATDTKTIRYVANTTDNVIDLPEEQNSNKEVCDNISTKKPFRSGYRFLGWSTIEGATSIEDQYNPGTKYCESEDLTLYAVWESLENVKFTVTYNANGGENAPSKQEGNGTDCVNISKNKPTLASSTFLGWSTDKDAKEPEKKFAAGAKYCGEEGDIVLYAVWSPKTGISTYFIAFAGVAMTAGAALYITKKKDLFKQI